MNTQKTLIELTFTESKCKNQKPIARYQGKLCLVIEYKLCLPGETWMCEIVSDKGNYMFVNPINRLKSISENIEEFNRKVESLKDKFNHKIIV